MITHPDAEGYHNVSNTFNIQGKPFRSFYGELTIASIVSVETFTKCLDMELSLLRKEIMASYIEERARSVGKMA